MAFANDDILPWCLLLPPTDTWAWCFLLPVFSLDCSNAVPHHYWILKSALVNRRNPLVPAHSITCRQVVLVSNRQGGLQRGRCLCPSIVERVAGHRSSSMGYHVFPAHADFPEGGTRWPAVQIHFTRTLKLTLFFIELFLSFIECNVKRLSRRFRFQFACIILFICPFSILRPLPSDVNW